jgi:hypothetical protein
MKKKVVNFIWNFMAKLLQKIFQRFWYKNGSIFDYTYLPEIRKEEVFTDAQTKERLVLSY